MILTETNTLSSASLLQLADLIVRHQEVVSLYGSIAQESRAAIIEKLQRSRTPINFESITLQLHTYIQAIEGERINFGKVAEKRLLKDFLKRIGLLISESHMDLIGDEDVVEVYDANALQIYRGLSFFSTTSYTLTDLLTNEWWHLFERNPFITKQLGDLAMGMFVEQKKMPVILNLPNHFAKEIWSAGKAECLMKHKAFIPVFDSTGTELRAFVNILQLLELQFKPMTNKPALLAGLFKRKNICILA